MTSSGNGSPQANWGEQGDTYVDVDHNVLWVKHPNGWCDVINNRHLSEVGGFYAALLPTYYPGPAKGAIPQEPEPIKGRVFDFE